MIIPKHWAEGKARHRTRGRQVTVRRFGWSNASPEEAQANADQRAADALKRILGGEKKLVRWEPKVSYNGADGLPIREEILSVHGETIITRNCQGVQCLNTPNILFADIDFSFPPPLRDVLVMGLLILALIITFWVSNYRWISMALAGFSLLMSNKVARWLKQMWHLRHGVGENAALNRVRKFATLHPDWHLRLYRTPAGLRVMALHRLFDPGEPEVAEFFEQLSTDPLYVRMCLKQQCFRARVSPKPWRVGIQTHIKPRPGMWPVNPARLPDRIRWVESYEQAAKPFASCKFLEKLGPDRAHPSALEVQHLHDELCQATSSKPLA